MSCIYGIILIVIFQDDPDLMKANKFDMIDKLQSFEKLLSILYLMSSQSEYLIMSLR